MKQLYLFLLALLVTATGWAKTTTWSGSNSGGSWTTNGNWNNGAPGTNDNVIFPTGVSGSITNIPNVTLVSLTLNGTATITLVGASANRLVTISGTGSNITVTSGAKLTLGTNINITVASNGTASISGQLIISNNRTYTSTGVTTVNSAGTISNAETVTSTAASLQFSAGSTYIHNQDDGTIPTATWNTTSNCTITGITGNEPAGLGQSFGNFTWNAAAQTGSLSLASALKTIKGDLIILNTNNHDLRLASNTALAMTIGGDFKIGSATDIASVVIANGTADPTLTIGGDLVLQNTGKLNLTNSDDGNTKLTVAGNLSMSGTPTLTYSSADGTGEIDLNGNYTQTGGTVEWGSVSETGVHANLHAGGDFSISGISTTANTTGDSYNGLITFTKAGVQTFTASDPDNLKYTNYTVASGSTLKLASNLALSHNGDGNPGYKGTFTVNSGGTLDASTFSVLSISGNLVGNAVFTLSAGGKLITANAAGVPGSIVAGTSPSIIVPSYSSAADYEFQSTSTGTFTTTPTAATARTITINNTTGNVLLAQPMAVTSTLRLTDGELNTTSNTITLNSGASATGYSDASFVNGPIKAVLGAGAGTTFPTGKTGVGLIPISISNVSTANTFQAQYKGAPSYSKGSVTVGGLAHVDYCQYWEFFTVAGTSTGNITIGWNAHSKCSAAPYVTDPATMRIARSTGTNWSSFGVTSTTSVSPYTAGSITWNLAANNITTATLFTLGSTVNNENPLPVTLNGVKAFEKNHGVEIDWSNLTETNVSNYVIERSVDGVHFTQLDLQQPKHNLNDRVDYTSFDASPVQGINYYRVVVTEADGKKTYSAIVRVSVGTAQQQGLLLYPNPVKNKQLSVALTGVNAGMYKLSVVNAGGQTVYTETLSHPGGSFTKTLQLPQGIQSGVYSLVISGDSYQGNKMFIVQ